MASGLDWVVALGVGAIAAELVRSFVQRRKMGAEAAKVITDSATLLLVPLQARIKELEAEIASCRTELATTKSEAAMATSELREARTEVSHLRERVREYEQQMDRRDGGTLDVPPAPRRGEAPSGD